jgi:hypothetical protein
MTHLARTHPLTFIPLRKIWTGSDRNDGRNPLPEFIVERSAVFQVVDPQKKSKVAVKLYENLKKSGVEAGNLEIIERETKELLDLIWAGEILFVALPSSLTVPYRLKYPFQKPEKEYLEGPPHTLSTDNTLY